LDSLLLDFGTLKLHWQAVVLSFLCSFFLSSLIAIVYERTFQGLALSGRSKHLPRRIAE
jgi:hypothetical protein